MRVLYEDDSCFVVDKPAGILVHPAEGKKSFDGTLLEIFRNKIKWDDDSDLRPGIVHRLDKDTSGVIVIVKNREAYKSFVEQFKSRTIKKSYLALVRGTMQHKEAIIDSPIGRSLRNRKKMALMTLSLGKNAISQYAVIKEFGNVSLLRIKIGTGRTHQIRVHMAGIGHPVVGDDTYGDEKFNRLFQEKFGLGRQFLHAEMIKFKSPDTKKLKTVNSKLPSDLETVLTKL